MWCERRTERGKAITCVMSKNWTSQKGLMEISFVDQRQECVKVEGVSINKYKNEGEISTCSPFRACVIKTSPSGVRSNRMTFPLCLNLGAPATYNLLQSPTITDDTV